MFFPKQTFAFDYNVSHRTLVVMREIEHSNLREALKIFKVTQTNHVIAKWMQQIKIWMYSNPKCSINISYGNFMGIN